MLEDFDYTEIPPAFIEVDLHPISDKFADIRQELFLNGDNSYMNHQKIIHEILKIGADQYLNELVVRKKDSAPF